MKQSDYFLESKRLAYIVRLGTMYQRSTRNAQAYALFCGNCEKMALEYKNVLKSCNNNQKMITFALKPHSMTIREWIREREISGFPTLTIDDVKQRFPLYSQQIIRNELFRLSSQGILCPAYRGFYVIIPPHYAAKRVVPAVYYIDQLMAYLKKPYYVSLLNAAELLGAAHQRPQTFSVMTLLPKSSVSATKNKNLVWVCRKKIPSDFLLSKNSETGKIYYSNPQLTALDLVQYEQYVGGLSRVATVLAELVDSIDFKGASQKLFNYTTLATIQRLGYVLDEVLQEKAVADVLHSELLQYVKHFRYVPLSIHASNENASKNIRWKVNVNTLIEVDEIW